MSILTKVSEDRMAHAKRALTAFNQLVPMYQSLLRAVTGKRSLVVKPTANISATDGDKVVYLMVPWVLGETREHDFPNCNLRDPISLEMLCPACDARDAIDGTVFHESAHITCDSFEPVDPQKITGMAMRLMPFVEIKKPLPWSYNGKPLHLMAASGLLDPVFLPQIFNVVEDIYVNRRLFAHRPGVEASMNRKLVNTFTKGFTNASGEHIEWSKQPLDMQAMMVAYLFGHNLAHLIPNLDPQVHFVGDDKVVQDLMHEIPVLGDIYTRADITFRLCARLRELGFCVPPSQREEEPDPDPQGDDSEEEQDEPQDGGDDNEDEPMPPQPGDPCPDGDPGTGKGGQGQDEDSEPGDEEDPDALPTAGGSGDPSDDDQEQGQDEDSDEESEDETGSGDQGKDEEDQTDDDEDEAQGSGDGDEADDESEDETDDADDPGKGGSQSDDDPMEEDDDDSEPSEEPGPTPEELDRKAAEELAKAMRQFMGHEDEEDPDRDYLDPDVDNLQPMPDDVNSQDHEALDQAIRFDKFDAPPNGVEDFVEEEIKRVRPDDHIDVPFDPGLVSGETARLRGVFALNRKVRLTGSLKSGPRLDVPNLHRIGQGDYRVFGRKDIPAKRDWFVLVGLDDSGSTTVNGAAEVIRELGLSVGEMLNGCGVKFAMYAHGGGKSTYVVRHTIIKSPDEPWTPDVKERFSLLGRSNTYNYDGHTMEQYRKVLQGRRETDKMLLYLTDGEMPQSNYREEVEVLKREIDILNRMKVNLFGVGYQTDSPKQYGMDTISIRNGRDLPGLVSGLRQRLEV